MGASTSSTFKASRLLKKFVTPVLANCGVTFLYVKAAGFKSFSSNFSLKIKMSLFRSSNGSFISSDYQIGDLNGDMLFDVLDIVLLSNLILSENYNESDFLLADLNSDGLIDILDIVLLINLILL